MAAPEYSPTQESRRILSFLCQQSHALNLPSGVADNQDTVQFHSTTDKIYFPIPFKETETLAALKSIEALTAAEIANLRFGQKSRNVSVSLEGATYFGCQAYMAKVGGLGKLDPDVRSKLKDTDLLAAQSNGYRRMSANLYRTKDDQFFHIHGSLEATSTLNMIGLEGQRPDLTDYQEIIKTIESHVGKYTAAELEVMNAERRQAGVTAYKYEDFIQTTHGKLNVQQPPWKVTQLKGNLLPTPFPATATPQDGTGKILGGIKVLELCRIIAGPTITRILAEYGADVLKITSPSLSDVPFFQVDGNMGKHAADLDLKSAEGRAEFEKLLADVDVFVDGYRPGALEKLGYGPEKLAELAEKRGKGIVYVNENCFGYEGEWAGRPGWQQIADCVTGIAWAQGEFMGLDSPMVPPFPISDYGTGCMGAIAALSGLYHRAQTGGSYHAKASLMHYDLLLFAVGQYPASVRERLRAEQLPEFLALRHHDSVDRISVTTLRMLRKRFPELFDPAPSSSPYTEKWFSNAYNEEIEVVRPVARIDGVDNSFVRASRPNGSDRASWEFGLGEGDYRREYVN
ncbi:Follicle-stimulating hormone receptor [Talaromyces islandicus]|uniref:Follicle-stimulating hormone receptor n=1 Tax=Talaromyces islandicus TaxID=28573 RepID=A0A0U1LRH2_TALIS|nr:Follicle-stimulating hormone receptor [Talaromyces islandicus]